MTSPSVTPTTKYADGFNDDAVIIPGRGYVFLGAVGTTFESGSDLESWIKKGDLYANLSDDFEAYGHTSLEDLPAWETETEGGEAKGSWQNHALATTPISTTETVTVKPIQITQKILEHRFGKGVKYDSSKKTYTLPDAYVPSEAALVIVIYGGDDKALALSFPRVSPQPDGSVELDAENFMALPVKYAVLQASGKPRSQITVTSALTPSA